MANNEKQKWEKVEQTHIIENEHKKKENRKIWEPCKNHETSLI